MDVLGYSRFGAAGGDLGSHVSRVLALDHHDRVVAVHRTDAAIPPDQLTRRVEVPSGFSIFRGDVVRPPRAWLDRVAATVRATEPPRGGHFAAFEEPELYAHELREFFRPHREKVGGGDHP